MTKKALEGLKVAEFSWVVAGAIVGLYLAQHGATVIRIESVHRPDTIRTIPPYKDNKPGINRAVVYTSVNSGKFGMSLNLSHPKGIEIAKRLVAWSDVVGENFAPGAMKRRGLDYEELRKIKPDIIMYSSSNLGQTGPEAARAGYGMHVVGYSGLSHITGWPDRVPAQPFMAYNDFLAPRFQVAAVLAAVDYRRRTGKGQYLDISQLEAGVHFMSPVALDYTVNKRIWTRDGNRCPYAAPHGAYPCQGDERWCAIGVFSDEEWDALCRVMGNPEWVGEAKFATLLGRKENEEELNERLGEWTKNFSAEEVMERLQAAGVSAGVVKNGADIQNDPQSAYRHYLWQLEHPEIGKQYYEAAGFTLSKTPTDIERPAPILGQHTEYVCREILGMSDTEFVDLFNQGVFE